MSGESSRRPPVEDLAWLGLIPAVAVLAIALEWLAPPLSTLYLDRGYDFYPIVREVWVRPEPEETAGFLLAVAVPLLLAAAILALGSRRSPSRVLDLPVVAVQLAGIGFIAWTVWKQRENVSIGFLGQFERSLLPRGDLIAAPLIGLALTAAALAWDGERLARGRELAARLGGIPAWAAPALAGLLTALWLLPGVITDESIAAGGLIPLGHVPIEFGEYVAAANGRTPLVDFVSWYSNLLPVSLAWLWPLFDWSITSFTTTMVVLSAAALLAVYAAFRQLTRGAWPALVLYLPFMAMVLQPWKTEGAVREFNGSYYATMPQRYLGPFLVLWLCARHLRRGSPPLWVLFLIAGVAAINNPDFGFAALLGLIAALVLGSAREGPLGPWFREAGLQAAAGLAGAVTLGCAVILLRSGELPHPDLLAYVARVTSRGYGLTPLPDWGLHWVLYVTYAAALLTAAVRFVSRSPDGALTGLLAFAGVFGLLTGAYFAGRSLPWQLWGLFGAWALALSLLAWTAWLALRSGRRDALPLRRVVVASFAALTGLGLMVASIDRLPPPWQQLDRISAGGDSRYDNLDHQRFIEARTEPGDVVLMLGTELEHRSAERAGVENVSPWFGTGSLFGPGETARAIDQLEESDGEAVFVRVAESGPYASGLLQEVNGALRRRGYAPAARNPSTGTVEWRRTDGGQ